MNRTATFAILLLALAAPSAANAFSIAVTGSHLSQTANT